MFSGILCKTHMKRYPRIPVQLIFIRFSFFNGKYRRKRANLCWKHNVIELNFPFPWFSCAIFTRYFLFLNRNRHTQEISPWNIIELVFYKQKYLGLCHNKPLNVMLSYATLFMLWLCYFKLFNLVLILRNRHSK